VDVEHVVGTSSGEWVREGHQRLPEGDRAEARNAEPDPWDGIAAFALALPSEGYDCGRRREAQVPEAVLSRSSLVDVRARQGSSQDRPVVLDLSVAEDTSRGPWGPAAPCWFQVSGCWLAEQVWPASASMTFSAPLLSLQAVIVPFELGIAA
jgi:hypothetical protein